MIKRYLYTAPSFSLGPLTALTGIISRILYCNFLYIPLGSAGFCVGKLVTKLLSNKRWARKKMITFFLVSF